MKKILLIMMAVALMLGLTMPTMAQQKKAPAKRSTSSTAKRSTGNTGSNAAVTFVLDNGTLGPIQAGKRITGLPKSYSGLYDKYVYKKEQFADMEGEWTEEHYFFYKNGKKVIDVYTSDKVISSISLLPGSSYIKTPEGFYVGCSARDVYSKKKMEWSTYYEGYSFATSNKITYYINSDDITNHEIPNKVSDIKPNAKIVKINYNVNAE